MRDGIVFCHGFAYDQDYWKSLMPYFEDHQIYTLDLGYFGKSARNLPQNPEQRLIGVGHSLGFLKLCQTNLKFDLLVGLNPFFNFLGQEKVLRRKRELELKMLKSSLIKSPKKTLEDFHTRSGAPFVRSKFDTLSLTHLLQDLDSLASPEVYKFDRKIAKKVFLLGSQDDPVVPKDIVYETCEEFKKKNHEKNDDVEDKEKNFRILEKISKSDLSLNGDDVRLEFIAGGGHALGHHHPGLIHGKIRRFLNEHI